MTAGLTRQNAEITCVALQQYILRCAVERIHSVASRLAAAVSCQSIASYHTADCRVEDCGMRHSTA